MSSTARKSTYVFVILVVVGVFLVVNAWWSHRGPQPGTVLDEARQANRPASSLTAADDDYFHNMDQNKGGLVPLTPEEVKGRNTWLVWTGGNDRLWNHLTNDSFGALDFLKTLSSHPSLKKFSRDNRWTYLGLVNEPCFQKATGPDPERFGLWLDKRIVSRDCPSDPFESEEKYRGVKVGSRGQDLPEGRIDQYLPKKMPVGSYYGYATGIVGLRLFPNPDFDEKAARDWDPERFYSDASYYKRKNLIRPYRVGMSCAFCHMGPNPIKPPADPENPKWENLSSNVGAQYFWVDRIFDWDADPSNYIFQMFHTSRPGTLDTSLVSTDNINNPRTMNAIYNLWPRLMQAKRFGKETVAGGSLNNKQLNDYVPPDSPLAQFFVKPDTVYSPRVLKDAADSVGALGALNRVYLNIGLFSEEWLLHFRPLIGGKKVSPIEIAVARNNSAYWEATEAQTANMALFFLKTATPHKLKDAPGGLKYLGDPDKDKNYAKRLDHGKIIFAENCARCHSSKLPTPADGLDPDGWAGATYLEHWEKYWAWTKTEAFKSKMREKVLAPDFLDGNFLSAEHRVPVTLLKTNACSPLATNAIRDNIWDNFSSETYKNLPSVGSIKVYQPETGQQKEYPMPGGGRGFTRPASLISVWSTAPFLLNNSVGEFHVSPSVDERMKSFQDSIEKMLLIKNREKDPVLAKLGIDIGVIDRSTERSYIRIAPGYVPELAMGLGPWLFPSVFNKEGGIELGPIPPGTPVSLLANLNVRPEGLSFWARIKHDWALLGLVKDIKAKLGELGPPPQDKNDKPANDAYDKRAREVLMPLADKLMEFSKCRDYVVNRGHYFGAGYDGEAALSEQDKRDLIEFLKTF
jgi:mono/diheme cytochrome c family protein